MKAFALIAILAACGRIGFDGPAASDGALGDGAGDGMSDGAPGGAATVAFVDTGFSVANQSTYTFTGVSIGPTAANRIVVVSAFLGGGAVTQINSITVGGIQLELTGEVVDPFNGGSIAVGYKLIPAGTFADITVTSANAGRAAIIVYNITANNEAPNESQSGLNLTVDTNSIGGNVDLRAGEVVIANAGHGSDNAGWTWSFSSVNFTELVDNVWSEQGSYSTVFATVATDGLQTVQAAPSPASAKLFNIATWR